MPTANVTASSTQPPQATPRYGIVPPLGPYCAFKNKVDGFVDKLGALLPGNLGLPTPPGVQDFACRAHDHILRNSIPGPVPGIREYDADYEGYDFGFKIERPD